MMSKRDRVCIAFGRTEVAEAAIDGVISLVYFTKDEELEKLANDARNAILALRKALGRKEEL